MTYATQALLISTLFCCSLTVCFPMSEDVQDNLELPQCLQPLKKGNCRASFRKFYYDAFTKKCNEFIYGGCMGNLNRFDTEEECMEICGVPFSMSEDDKDNLEVPQCLQPLKKGNCLASFRKFYYDAFSKKCNEFIYGGCMGNLNRFDTEKECRETCGVSLPMAEDNKSNMEVPQCLQPVKKGNCRAIFRKFYYDTFTKKCNEFIYGGCMGNLNRFDTEEECMQICGVSFPMSQDNKDNVEVPQCLQPFKKGNCLASFRMFYYDAFSKKCNEFIYGGCMGNLNRFDTEEECMQICGDEPDEPAQTYQEKFDINSLTNDSISDEADSIYTLLYTQTTSTEVTETVWLHDNSLDIDIGLPVLVCHSKQVGYKEVLWYKDNDLLRRGSSDLANHRLSLIDLLRNDSSFSTAHFDHPLKLQGYYWCETDHMNETVVHSYLFRIKEISTFIGKFVSKEDSLSEGDEGTLEDKITLKKATYEKEMEEVLFGFLPKPNTYVVDISSLTFGGLEVRFYLFARRLFHPRRPDTSVLEQDQDELESVLEYLRNETTEVDEDLYLQILDWSHTRGIDIQKMNLKSTLGCYEEKVLVLLESPGEVTWPYADIGEVVIPKEGCSSKSGLAVTRRCTGSFKTGAKWEVPSEECSSPPNDLTVHLRDLHDKFGVYAKPLYMEKLKKLTRDPMMLTVTDLHIVTNILTEMSEIQRIPSNEMDSMFSVIDDMAETNKTELDAAKSTIKLTSRLLKIIGNVLAKASQSKQEILIAKKHILVDAKNTREKEDHVVGLAILSSSGHNKNTLTDSFFQFLLEGSSLLPQKKDFLAYFLLPPDLVTGRENETTMDQTQVNVVFFKDWFMFPTPKDVLKMRNYDVLPSPVMYVSITGGPAWNLTDAVRLYFKNDYGNRIKDPVCVQFDPRMEEGEGAWNSEGCEYAGLKDGFYSCLCHHLSIFAVVLAEKPDYTTVTQFRLGTAVYVGCAASIIALSFTVILYGLSKVWRKTVDHNLLFWLSLSFLCFFVLLFTSETRFKWKPGCMMTAFLLHYFVLVVVAWLLMQAIMHKFRFANKTDMSEVPHFVLKAAVCCWGFPVFILTLIWFTKDFRPGKGDSCFKAISDVSRWTLLPIAVILVVTLCLNVCAVYAVTCRFKKDYLIGNLGYDESVLKFRVAVTIYFFFVMSYIFGFLALQRKSRELRILFSISITLTAYYVTLFFVFQEVSLWEMCRKWKQRRSDESESDAVKYVASKNYTEDETNQK